MSLGKFPALRSVATSQTRINSQRPSISKTNTPAVKFKDEFSSPTETHKISERSSPLLSPLLRLEEADIGSGLVPKPVDISLDPGVDGVFDQALVRLDQLLDRQAQKSHMKKLQLLGTDKHNQPRLSTVSNKNMQIVQRVTKYKNMKGINPKTKEVRFEERLAPFKDVKTFVDIRKIVKDMGSPVASAHVHSGNVSSGTPKVNMMTRVKNAPVLEGFNEMYEQIEIEQSPIPTPGSGVFLTSPAAKRHSANNDFFSSLQSKLKDVADVSMVISAQSPETAVTENYKHRKSRLQETSPEVSEKIQEAHKKIEEQLKRHMGPRVRSKLGKALEKKDVFERIAQRKQSSLHQMRETQKDLSDMDAFHTLMEILSERDVSKEGDSELDFAKEEGPETFYTRLEKNILKQEEEENDEFTDGRKTAFNEVPEIEEDDERKTYEMDDLPNNLFEDEQIRIMATLQAYKKRSDKIIQILKKKTKKLQQEVVLKKSAVVKEKLSTVLKTIPTIRETPEEHVGTIASAIGLRADSLANKGRASLWRSSIRIKSFDHMPDIKRETPSTWDFQSRKMSETGSRVEFDQKVKENKKKFIELQQQNKKKSFYLTQYESRKSWLSKVEDSAGSLGSFYDEKMHKNQTFNKSLKKICGDVSELLTTNKSLNTEVKRTIVEREKYYSGKVREITDQEVPEALIMHKRPDFTHKKAKFIMNLTKHLLKER